MGFVYEQSLLPVLRLALRPGDLRSPLLPRVRLLRREVPQEPGDRPGRRGRPHALQQYDQRRRFQRRPEHRSSSIGISRTTSARRRETHPATPATRRLPRICFVNVTAANDMRFFQSSGPLNLAPGQFGSIVVAYVFAAPLVTADCSGPGTCRPDPGRCDPAQHRRDRRDPNPVDRVAGYVGFTDDGDGVVEQTDFTVAPRSLYGRRWSPSRFSTAGSCCPSPRRPRPSSWSRGRTR